MQKLKYVTHPILKAEGQLVEFIALEVFSIYDTKPNNPHAMVTWSRKTDADSWGSPFVELSGPGTVAPKDAADYAAILRSITTAFEEVKNADTNPDALIVGMDKDGGEHVVVDMRVGRLVGVSKLKEADGKFWKPAGTSVPIIVKAADEEAAVPLVSAAFARQCSNPSVAKPFAKWVEGGCKVVESETGATPDVAPLTGYLTRAQEKKALERKAK